MAELNPFSGRSGGRHLTKKLNPRVDLTAMVDLAFLLITFFMLTTSLAKHREMPVVMPADGPSGPVPESATMTILLGKHNQLMYYLGMADKPLIAPTATTYGKGMCESIMQIKKKIRATSGKPMMIIVKPSDHSVYANLVDVLDEIDITQVPSYAIAPISPKDIDILKTGGAY